MNKHQRSWLAFANSKVCRHANAIHDKGFINWGMKDNFHFSVGDIIYLFVSNERRVVFQMEVIAENCPREDQSYWIIDTPNDRTYKLLLRKEYNGKELNESVLKKNGFNGGGSIQNPTYKNERLLSYIESVFDKVEFALIGLPTLAKRPILYVDLFSGRYVSTRIGHEVFNLDKNPVDGRYYGYCPAYGNVSISELGARPLEESISGVIVVYTKKMIGSSDRELIAFCDNATIHRKGIYDDSLQRTIEENGEKSVCSYAIESDTLFNLSGLDEKFVIHVADYSTWMFRQQRFYKGTYPKLDDKIISYIEAYLKKEESEDDLSYQEAIQDITLDDEDNFKDTSKDKPDFLNGNNSKMVKKNPKIAKQALAHAKYRCVANPKHITFNTAKGKPYMEGHHLIPCTQSNATLFWQTRNRNIDCENNIVCLCPTCHRRIHYGSIQEKKSLIKTLYDSQIGNLKKVGLDISLDELLKLYSI